VPELIDPVFTKTSPKPSFSVIENERFGLVFAKTGSINSDQRQFNYIEDTALINNC
jgi:hypothetical protein